MSIVKFRRLDEANRNNHEAEISSDKIYSDWYRYLSLKEREYELERSETLIYNANQVIEQLKDSEDKSSKILSVYNDLVYAFSENSAMAIMAVVLTKILNSLDNSKHITDSTYKDVLGALYKRMESNKNFTSFMEGYFNKNTFPLSDYPVFDKEDPFICKTEIVNIDEKLREIVSPLKKLFGEAAFKDFELLLHKIVGDENLKNLLCKIKPNTSKNFWRINEQMLCNIIGLFNNRYFSNSQVITINKLNTTLLPSKDRTRSIRDCITGELKKDNLKKIQEWIDELKEKH